MNRCEIWSDPAGSAILNTWIYYQNLPLTNDSGGIHSNCGIHNLAAFNIMVSKDEQGHYLFDPQLIAQIFYHALIALGAHRRFL